MGVVEVSLGYKLLFLRCLAQILVMFRRRPRRAPSLPSPTRGVLQRFLMMYALSHSGIVEAPVVRKAEVRLSRFRLARHTHT